MVLGAAASDTAMWINSLIEAAPAESAGVDGDGNEVTPPMPEVEEHYRQGLRYNELIAPMIKSIQELTARVAALEG